MLTLTKREAVVISILLLFALLANKFIGAGYLTDGSDVLYADFGITAIIALISGMATLSAGGAGLVQNKSAREEAAALAEVQRKDDLGRNRKEAFNAKRSIKQQRNQNVFDARMVNEEEKLQAGERDTLVKEDAKDVLRTSRADRKSSAGDRLGLGLKKLNRFGD